ncbi:MAG: SNF2-related protein [Deltaproteobacteria bacterium]
MSSSIAGALSTLSDRGLRRLLGARTFLRGLDYEKRKVVGDLQVNQSNATARIKGSDADPYQTTIQLGGDGITSECSCPAFQKTGHHCKHVAALLITVRNQARALQPPRRDSPPAASSSSQSNNNNNAGNNNAGNNNAGNNGSSSLSSGSLSNGQQTARDSKPSRRRERRRRTQLQAVPSAGIIEMPTGDGAARTTGLGAWLAPESARRVDLEYRVHVRAGGLTITLLDLGARVPLLPSAVLAWQALTPTADRDALRILARFESGNIRHPAVDVRGEDAAELLPQLEGRRVLLEPALMQLRFSSEVLRPHFDLEMVGSDTIVAKVSFEREGNGRRFSLTSGGWFEGNPGYHIDTTEGIARPIDVRVSPAALRRLLRAPTIAEPAHELIQLITHLLPRLSMELGAPLPDLSQVADVVDLPAQFRMRAGGSLVKAEVALRTAYGDIEVEVRADGISPPIIVKPPSDGQLATCVRADIVAQQKAVELLLELGLKPDEAGEGFIAEGDDALRFWSEGIGSLPESWDLYVPEELVGVQVRSKPIQMQARVSSGVDWLNVQITWESDGVSIDRKAIEQCLREGKKFVRLSDDSYAPLDAERVEALVAREIDLIASEGKNGKLPLSQAGRVQELLNQLPDAKLSAGAKQFFKKLSSIEEIKAVKKPRALRATLRPYQEQGLSWLKFIHDLGTGGILADDMGLGKTVQAIALLLLIKQEQKDLRVLIVAPTSVVSNWMREIERFGKTLTTALWHGAGRKEQQKDLISANVIITSYALLRRDIDLLTKLQLDYVILDEAQAIKNPHSATAQAAKELMPSHRLALTGTPIENRLTEIWSIFDFVSPGILPPLAKFDERFSRPIDQGDSKAAARLKAIIHPFILRRTKMEVAKDLPAKIESDKVIDLGPEQRGIYTQVLREVRAQVLGELDRVGVAKSQLHILAGLTKLRQAACDPRLLGLPREFSHEDSAKVMAFRELVEEAEAGGHRVLVFSQFVSMLKILKSALDEDRIRYEYLDGSTQDRMERIDRFQNDPTIPVFLISLKAGGSGLNLTAADTVIHFDPWWNPAVEDQASDRAHRIGQKKVVTVYRLVAAGTIEEKILELKEKKKELVSAVLTEDSGGAKKLSRTDLEDLFKVD